MSVYIIRLQETFFECTAVHLVMEYASGGDLFERIVERTKLTNTVTCSPKMGTKKKKKRQNLNHTQSKKKKKDVVQSTLLGWKVIARQDNVEDKMVTEVHNHNDKPSSFENDGNKICNTDRRQNSSSLKSSRPQQQTTLSKWIKK